MNRVVIGLVGEKCAGKEKFWELFCEVASEFIKEPLVFTFNRFSTSTMLAEILERCGANTGRNNKIALVQELEEKFGEGTVASGMYRRLKNDRTTVKVIDSVRLPADEEALRKEENNILLYITADANIRYDRHKARNRDTGDDKTTFEEFLAGEKASTEKHAANIGSRANWKIENNFNDEELLKDWIRIFFKCKVKPLLEKEE